MASTGDRADARGSLRPLRPQGLYPLVAVVGAEGLLLIVGAGWLLFGLLTGRVLSVGATLFLVVLFAGAGAILLRAVLALWRGRRWPRSVALTAQLFAVLIAGTIIRPVSGSLALIVVLAAILAGMSLFRPAVVDWTTQDVPTDRL